MSAPARRLVIHVNQPPPSLWKRLARIRWIRGTLEALNALQAIGFLLDILAIF